MRYARNPELNGIFHYQWQQRSRGLATVDRAMKPRRQQPGNAPHMINMHMRHNQRTNVINRKLDIERVAFIRALEGPAVYEYRVATRQAELMA